MLSLLTHYQTAFVATILAAATIPAVHIVLIRTLRRPEKTVPLAFPCFALSFALFLWIAYMLTVPFDAARLLFGIGLLGFLWLGYLAVLFHLYRGFSNTLLSDIERLGSATVEDIMAQFAEGSGSEEMLQRRLRTMASHALITMDGDTMHLTPKGARSARLTLWYKHVFAIGSGG